MAIETILIIIWLHFVGDFILQTDKMAINKSKSLLWLGVHALVYGLPFYWFGWQYALINSVAHGLVDFVTSKINARLWAANKRHWFFVGVGIDQAIHMTILILTFDKRMGW